MENNNNNGNYNARGVYKGAENEIKPAEQPANANGTNTQQAPVKNEPEKQAPVTTAEPAKKEKKKKENKPEKTTEENKKFLNEVREAEYQEKREWKEKRHNKRAKRSYRGRTMKNLMIWFAGFFTSVVLFATAIFVCIGVIPLGTYLGKDASSQVSDEIANQSLLDTILNIDKYKVSDVPALVQLLKDNEAQFDAYITIDYDKLEQLSFNELSRIGECITVTASVSSLGISLGDLGTLDIFTTSTEVTLTDVEISADSFNCKLYYYYTDTNRLTRAFDDSKNLIAPAGAKIYLPALEAIPILEMTDLIDDRLQTEKISTVMQTFGGVSGDNMILDILGDTTVAGLNTFDFNTVKLSKVLELPTASNSYKNQDLYDMLVDFTPAEKPEDITIGMLSDITLETIYLHTVLDVPTAENSYKNKQIYDILLDATTATTYDEISLAMLGNASFNDVKLINVIDEPTAQNEYKNKEIFDMLLDATGKTSYSDLTVEVLNGFKTSNVSFGMVLAETGNEKLYQVLGDSVANYLATDSKYAGTGATLEDLKIGDLSSAIKTQDIKLCSVITTHGGNKILARLIADETITMANIGTAINNLKFYDVYGAECFVESATGEYCYNEELNKYGLISEYGTVDGYSGTYALNEESGIWTFMCFDAEVVDSTNGKVKLYSASNLTFAMLENDGGILNSKISGATIRQLADAGIITEPSSGYDDTIASKTLQDVVDALA